MTWDQVVPIIVSILSVFGFGSYVSGRLLRRIDRMAKQADAAESARKEEDDKLRAVQQEESVLILGGIQAIGKVSEATALSLKHGHTNGEVDAALKDYNVYNRDLNQYLLRRNAEK